MCIYSHIKHFMTFAFFAPKAFFIVTCKTKKLQEFKGWHKNELLRISHLTVIMCNVGLLCTKVRSIF